MSENFQTIDNYFESLKNAINNIDKSDLIALRDIIYEAGQRKAAIYLMGNGGSASMASHMACDLGKGASYGYSQRYNAIALNDNIATLLAYSNDVSYDDIFVEQLKTF